MADVEEPKLNSLADRIAALNQQKNFSTPPPGGKRPPPPPPPGKAAAAPASVRSTTNGADLQKSPKIPARPQRREPPPVLPQRTKTSDSTIESRPNLPGRIAPPPLPGRKDSGVPSPALPPRRPSTQQLTNRRGSNASELSQISTISNLSLAPISSRTSTTSTETQYPPRRVLAPSLDQAKLPPLPRSRKEREAQAAKEAAERERTEVIKAPLVSARSAPAIPQIGSGDRPGLPPRLSSRPGRSTDPAADEASYTGPRRLPPPPSAFVRPNTTLGSSQRPPSIPTNRTSDSSPPPVPVASRPTFDQIKAVTVRAAESQAKSCLVCRDFSGPDSVAAQYPNHSLPRHDPVGYLANVLCGPFPSATDKARAIFTWCHHNIAYNVEEFFAKCIKGRDVSETIFHGKAVCQGYAEVYQAIAQRAGLQCVVVGGHGKGYGYTPLTKGQAPPRKDPSGHAWNAVCIDNGEWKLLDACWGAGSVGEQQFHKKFNPEMFCLSNERFGLKHFPRNKTHFYRNDGRVVSWEEYMIGPVNGERAQWYGTGTEEGFSEFTFSPAEKHIPVHSGKTVRFQFSKICEHWVPEKHGKGSGYLLLMKIHGTDGRKEDLVTFETDGFWWWADIPARDLGAPGQKVFLYALTTLNNRDARGVTKEEYYRVKGSGGYSMSWAIYCQWELV
ncbi:Uu.00g054000.m01.CDS01 [Anthostomella pinea]|uniref:Uu.00g054000.m01.CDS01 n=1 Tax=Anthostomella pinea TaxID=933095 RepID=A0AAI8VX60_9PEZI|nr:Uu.00g054000.m01.CDS01 [Anthostomella pinea]